ncbi:sulfatase-like hydrolase/transferase [Paraglaciecola aquimarina]|uniref:Sulfatase-like hydrolase/transferase n=1 Tax=Paraglaciecola aquimarina TaxID=1235557 RepID=A0ABU3STD2_9ALTE|nr:sulfatase-like hydrolase/transferase [Paraglaciecola aquimarina]MDU0353269.1 sulfatase-like hydrolase/transferase [Paraglaciecola aquimarina]
MKILIMLIACLAFTAQVKAQDIRVGKTNIILIMADDLGYGDLGSYDGIHQTPNLDQLAKEGMRFTDFHSSGTLCSPTRAGLITGRYQQKSGVDGVVNADPAHPSYRFGVDPNSQVTFPNLVKAKGYKTALMGKWHIGYEKRYHPMNFGFDRFVGFLSGNIDYISHYDRMGTFDWWHNNQLVDEAGYSTQLITKHAIDFIKTNKDKPFVLYVAHEAVHNPMQGPNSPIQRGPNKQKQDKNTEGSEVYKEVIAELDISVGKIVETVKREGLSNNTLILFTSDNGPMPLSSAGALRGEKGSLFEGGHRVPTIAWWPNKIKANTVNNQLAISLDIMPTVLSLTGASVPKGHQLDGVNLLPSLLGQAQTKRQLYWRNGGLTIDATDLLTKDISKAMRSDKWKLIVSPYYKEVSLYDLSEDLSEQHDVADKYPQIVKEMTLKVKAWEDGILPYLPYRVIAE